MLGPEVASRVEALVGPALRPWSDRFAGWPARAVFSSHVPLLAPKLAALAAIVFLGSTAVLSSWITSRIESAVIAAVAGQLAWPLQMTMVPVGKALTNTGQATSPNGQALTRVVDQAFSGEPLKPATIWQPDGTIIFASEQSLAVGKMPFAGDFAAALAGHVTGQFTGQPANTAAANPVLAIYVPVRAAHSHGVVAVAEFRKDASDLVGILERSTKNILPIVGGLMLALTGLMFAGAMGASRRMERHQSDLESQRTQGEILAERNAVLRHELQLANRRGIDLNERFLRRISSDLHDGPAQHLALALLRLDELTPLVQAAEKARGNAPVNGSVLPVIRQATNDALREIRNISSGLALPELQKISPSDALGIAARAHERATGTAVALAVTALPPRLPLPVTICLFRFAQEGLNNAFRHAAGKGQKLSAHLLNASIEVTVEDEGQGFSVEQKLGQNERIGLAGLRNRVETLGGSLEIQSAPGAGTRLRVRFPLTTGKERHG